MFRYLIHLVIIAVLCTSVLAQELTDKQRELANRYAQLEQILFRLAETTGQTQPQQAALLKKAILESKDKLLVRRFESLVEVLSRRQLTDAVTGQTEIEQDLLQLLTLLENANRPERRDKEKEQIKELLKDLEGILHSERSLKNQTQQTESSEIPKLEKNQQDIRQQAQSLQDKLSEHEGTPTQSESQSESPSETPSEQSAPQKEQSASQQALQKSLEKMKQAEQKLQQAEKAGAIEEQEEAIAELQRLKEELEKILRQIREEELMQTLEKLEERFKRMLQQEQTLRLQTEQLSGEPKGETNQRQIKVRADRLGNDQQSIIEEAETALLILREDGTAQAMVESLLQARFDMTDVKNRLMQTQVDTATIYVEEAVIDALQEMLNAVQTAMQEAKERQEQAENQPSSGGGAMEEPLIQLLAELRMIRSMQNRVNERTKRYDDDIKQAMDVPDTDLTFLKLAVEELARQQNRIARILYELKIGKTN